MNSRARAKSKDSNPVADRLIDVAEQLFGIHGLESISLRQISTAAGTGNNYAVQYHFGDLAGLIRAVSEKRLPDVERLRAQYLLRAKEEKRLEDTAALMDVIYRPLFEYRNEQGERAYARFVLAMLNSPLVLKESSDLFQRMPIAAHALDLIASANPAIPPALLMERQRLASLMVLNSLFNRLEPWSGSEKDSLLIENIMSMATSALVAPVSKSISRLAKRSSASAQK